MVGEKIPISLIYWVQQPSNTAAEGLVVDHKNDPEILRVFNFRVRQARFFWDLAVGEIWTQCLSRSHSDSQA
jgi:hypothetical protein